MLGREVDPPRDRCGCNPKTEVLGIQVLSPTGQGTPATAPGLCEGPMDLGRLGKAAPQDRLSRWGCWVGVGRQEL